MRGRVGLIAAVALVAGLLGPTPALAEDLPCAAPDVPPADPHVLRAGDAVGRGIFVTYTDGDTVLPGGTVAPPDLGAPVASASVDRTGLGAALASPLYSPYSDAAGVLNAFVGTQLPVGGISEPSRAKVAGRPPQEQTLELPAGPGGGGCVRLAAGPSARAAARTAWSDSGVTLRLGDVRAGSGPGPTGATSTVRVVLHDVTVSTLHLGQVVLDISTLADGAAGAATATATVLDATLAGAPITLTPNGFAGGPPPDAGALAAAGVELLSAGSVTHTASGGRSVAAATGPVLRLTSPDGRVLTLVLGQATASAEYERLR
jgi:hypothetical protein